MYCVKCGVKLQEGVHNCPLCTTPVWNPGGGAMKTEVYPNSMPSRRHRRKIAILFVISILCMILSATIFLICKKIYGSIAWGGIADLGIILSYIIFILPLWFNKPNPVVFIPIMHAAATGYLWYICIYTHGSWFGSFAAPVIGIGALITTAFAALLKYVQGGRYYIFSGLFLLSGGATMLIELFQHITFNTPMFVWSLYSVGACSLIGIVLLLAAIIRPMREFFNRIFFI